MWLEHAGKLSKRVDADKLNPILYASKAWRLQNLYPILNKQGQLIRFKFNKFQRHIYNLLASDSRKEKVEPVTILKARQLGVTTFFCLYFLDDAIHNKGSMCAIQSHLQESINDIFKVVKLAFDNMVPAFKPSNVGHNTLDQITFPDNNSFIEIKLSIRSKAINRILFSEKAFQKPDRITATQGSLSPDALIINESTANGYNGFYKDYKKSKDQGRSFFFPWWKSNEYKLQCPEPIEKAPDEETLLKRCPEITDGHLLYRRKKLTQMNVVDFQVEYPSNDEECFVMSGSQLIDKDLLVRMREEIKDVKPIQEIREFKNEIRIYETLEQVREKTNGLMAFYVGVDSAEGVGGDYSTALFFYANKEHEMHQVATIHGYAQPDELAREVVKLCRQYSFEENGVLVEPFVVAERNNHGHAFLSFLKNSEEFFYSNLYNSIKDKRRGFNMQAVTKRAVLGDLFNGIRENMIKFKDEKIIDELGTLELDNNKINASEGYHDDLVIASALAFHGHYSGLGIST